MNGMTRDEALEATLATLGELGELTPDGAATAAAWVDGKCGDGTPRVESLATREGATLHRTTLRAIGRAPWIPMMVAARGGRVDRYAVLAIEAGVDTRTKHCNHDPPPNGVA